MLTWLMTPALTIAGTPMTWAEILGFLTGVLNVWLLVRQRTSNWPVGIVNVLLLMAVFWASGLYADASLQSVYVVLGAFGWWQWVYGGADRGALVVTRTGRVEWLGIAAFTVLATAGLWVLLDRVTDSTVPGPDAFTTVLSLVATYGQTRKLVESWWIWILADLIYIPLYLYKGLWLTSVLYVVFLGLCVAGLVAWRGALRESRPLATA